MAYQNAMNAGDLEAGLMTRVMLDGRAILIANVDGEFLAADDSCTHEEVSLCKGALMGHLVMCPYHGSRFDLRNGDVLEDPAEEPLRVYPVRVQDGVVQVDIG